MFTTKPGSDTPESVLQTITEIKRATSKIYGVSGRMGAKVPVTEAEQLDELSANTLASYRKKTSPSEGKMDNLSKDKLRKRLGSRTTAADKLTDRARVGVTEAEQIDEISTNTLSSYMDKARKSHKDLANKAAEATSKGFWEKDKAAQADAKTYDNKARQRAKGMFRAGMKQSARKLTEDLTRTTRGKYFGFDQTHLHLDPKAKLVERYTNKDNENFELYKNSNNVFELRDSKRQILNTWHTDNKEVRQETLVRYGLEPRMVGEAAEPVVEMSTNTLKRYVEARSQEYSGAHDNESPAAKDRKARRDKQISIAKKKLAKEEVEQIDELSKGTLGRYVKTAIARKDQHDKNARSYADLGREWQKDGEHEKAGELFNKAGGEALKASHRARNIPKAIDKLTKEGVEDSFKRLVGTKSLLKTYLDDTPGQKDASKDEPVNESDEGWYTHHEIHGKISKEDWKKGWRYNQHKPEPYFHEPTKTWHTKVTPLNEEAEQIDEISQGVAQRYLVARGGRTKRPFNSRYHKDIKADYGDDDEEVKYYDKMETQHQAKRRGIANAKKRAGAGFDREEHIQKQVKGSSDLTSRYKGYQETPHGSGYVVGKDDSKEDHAILRVHTGGGVRSKNDNPTKDVSVHIKHLKEGVE